MRIVCWQTNSCNIIRYFCRKLGKMSQNLSPAAVVIGALRAKCHLLTTLDPDLRRVQQYERSHERLSV